MFEVEIGKVVGALKPYGPTPIVAVTMGVAALGALAAGANAIAVVIIVFLVFALHIYGQERKAILREHELRVELDNFRRIGEAELTGRLAARLRKKRDADPTVGEQN